MNDGRTRAIGGLVGGLLALAGSLVALPERRAEDVVLIAVSVVAAAAIGWALGVRAVRPGAGSALVLLLVGTFGALLWGFLLVATIFALSGDLGIGGAIEGTPGQVLYGAVVFGLPWAMAAELVALAWVGIVRVLSRAMPSGRESNTARA